MNEYRSVEKMQEWSHKENIIFSLQKGYKKEHDKIEKKWPLYRIPKKAFEEEKTKCWTLR